MTTCGCDEGEVSHLVTLAADRLASLSQPPRAEMTRIYVRWSDDGQHIRKWSREPFEDGEAVDAEEHSDLLTIAYLAGAHDARRAEVTREEVLEEAARLCDERAAGRVALFDQNGASVNAHKAVEAEECATAIRALATRDGRGESL